MQRFLLVTLLICLFAVPAQASELHISAAASLKDSLNELSDLFKKKNSLVSIKNNFGGSGALAKQIEAGAPADLFFSANQEWVKYLVKKKLAYEKSIAVFAYNQLQHVTMKSQGRIILMDYIY